MCFQLQANGNILRLSTYFLPIFQVSLGILSVVLSIIVIMFASIIYRREQRILALLWDLFIDPSLAVG